MYHLNHLMKILILEHQNFLDSISSVVWIDVYLINTFHNVHNILALSKCSECILGHWVNHIWSCTNTVYYYPAGQLIFDDGISASQESKEDFVFTFPTILRGNIGKYETQTDQLYKVSKEWMLL